MLRFTFTFTLFLTLLFVSSGSGKEPHSKLKPLAGRIGTWTADLMGGDGTKYGTTKATWSYILDSQFMKMESEVSIPDYGYEAMSIVIWGWSAEKNGYQVTDFNSEGKSRQFIAKMKDGKITYPAEDGNQLGVAEIVEEFDRESIKSVSGMNGNGEMVWQLTNFKKKK